jgi:hypothetical protein
VRLVPLLLLAACTRPAPAPVLAGRSVDVLCDEAAWQHLASSPLRARVGDRDVIVVEEHAGWSSIVIRDTGRILAGEVRDGRLARVVKRETPVWDGPGGSPLPGLVVEPGTPVSGSGAWLEVHVAAPINVGGYVPADVVGRIWEATPWPDTYRRWLGFYGDVLGAPSATAQHVAGITGGERVVDSIEPGPAGWLKVTASDPQVHVTGWVAVPPPRPPATVHTYEFSDDAIEGELVHPDGNRGLHITPDCLRASPSDRAAVVGIATEPLPGTPAADGWLRVETDTPWGRVEAYGHAAPSPVELPRTGSDEPFSWPYDGPWR